MEKTFYIKREDCLEIFHLNLSSYQRDIDYKLILRLFTKDKHKNFIEGSMTHKCAYNVLKYYFFTSFVPTFDSSVLYKNIVKHLGPLGLTIFLESLNENIQYVIYGNEKPINLNSFKK